LPAVSVIRQFAHNGLSLAAKDVFAVRELFELLEAGNADGRAPYGRAS